MLLVKHLRVCKGVRLILMIKNLSILLRDGFLSRCHKVISLIWAETATHFLHFNFLLSCHCQVFTVSQSKLSVRQQALCFTTSFFQWKSLSEMNGREMLLD